MKNITEARAEASLLIKVRYDEGIMTRKEWIDMQKNKGWYAEEGTKNRIQYNRIKYNRMTGKEQEEYERKCNERIPCYNLKHPDQSTFFEITKAEFNYFNTL